MRSHCQLHRLMLAVAMTFAATVSAHQSAKPVAATPAVASTASPALPASVQNIAPAAIEAVKVVDGFSAAIKAARLDDAAKLLDPDVLILESGSSERSRAEYLRKHAREDAAFMQTAQQQLRYRKAWADGEVAWVGSESVLQTVKDGKPLRLLSSETMLLRNGPQGWKIVHIHWSSRRAPESQQQRNPAT